MTHDVKWTSITLSPNCMKLSLSSSREKNAFFQLFFCLFLPPPAFSDFFIQKPFRPHTQMVFDQFCAHLAIHFFFTQSKATVSQHNLCKSSNFSATHIPRRPFLNGLVLFDQFCALAKLRRALHYCIIVCERTEQSLLISNIYLSSPS